MRFVFLLILVLPLFSTAQHGKRKSKVSNSQGTLFGSWGYNRSWYTKSAINFVGPGYDFTFNGSKATDLPSYNLGNVGATQYNARLGYYFKNFLSVSIGFDHMKYAMVDQNNVLLNGTINPGVDTVTDLSGTYLNQELIIDTTKFNYRNYGLNYINLKISRTDQWIHAGKKNEFVIASDLGVTFGGILSSTDFNFAGKKSYRTQSFSGLGIAAYTGVRFEFFRHIYIQSGFSGGYIHQFSVRTQESEANATAKHKFGFSQVETTIGFLLYVRPTNDCNSCPHW